MIRSIGVEQSICMCSGMPTPQARTRTQTYADSQRRICIVIKMASNFVAVFHNWFFCWKSQNLGRWTVSNLLKKFKLWAYYSVVCITQCVQPLTLKYQPGRLKYLAFPNPYLRETLLLALLYILGLATAVSIQSHMSHLTCPYIYVSLNISQLMFSILKTVCCIFKILCNT